MPIPEPEKGITGFCPCCGAPRVYGVIEHDEECIWYEESGMSTAPKICIVSRWSQVRILVPPPFMEG